MDPQRHCVKADLWLSVAVAAKEKESMWKLEAGFQEEG